MEFSFDVLQQEIENCEDLRVGDAVIPAGTHIEPGGYEYDDWRLVLEDRKVSLRVEHRSKFACVTVDGETREEIIEKVRAAGDGFRESNNAKKQ